MTGEPARELVSAGYAWEIADAPELHAALNLADLAHALELADRGIVPVDARRPLLGALLDLAALPADAVDYDPRHGELYDARERHLEARLGPHAGWLRAGRTRREAVRTSLRIRVRAQVLSLIEEGTALAAALADRGEEHAVTLMPDYTYLQQAQPTTFGHYLLSFADPALRDARRLLAELHNINLGPVGCGAANGSRILRDRPATARALGFEGAIEHTRDAMWQYDPFLHVLTAATSLLLNQDKLAEDLEIFASAEFGFVELADGYSRPSIAMPQKRNPYSLTVIRGSAGVLIGRLAGQAAVAKSPSARSDNLIYLYGELPRALDMAQRVTGLSTAVIRTLAADPARMRAALNAGFTQATDLAELLMERFGADYRTAHRVVRAAIDRSAASLAPDGDALDRDILDGEAVARAAADVTGQAWLVDDAELRRELDPCALVESRTALGGAAAAPTRAMIARIRAATGELRAAVAARRHAIEAAEDAVWARARILAGR
jgi:argininosuccinate lyase